MNLDEIEEHWKNWAKEYKFDLRATTKTRTIKDLEVAALFRAFKKTNSFSEANCEVLEVGCGNGYNCFSLKQLIAHFNFTAVDFIPEMIASAQEIKKTNKQFEQIRFLEGNALELDKHSSLNTSYDIVFTNRCLINLNSLELQIAALKQIKNKTVEGGHIVLIENIQQSHAKQNQLREAVALEKRTPDKFNLFIDEPNFLQEAKETLGLDLVYVENFASLHDIILYVLLPMVNEGKIDYEHPLVAATSKLLLSQPDELNNSFGDFGQNRLYLFKKYK